MLDDQDNSTAATHLEKYLDLDWLIVLLGREAKNTEFVSSTLNLISLVMYSDNPQMNIMLSKYKLVDILSKCWSDETASLILDVLINGCLTDFYNNSKYTQLRWNLVKSTELMSWVLDSALN